MGRRAGGHDGRMKGSCVLGRVLCFDLGDDSHFGLSELYTYYLHIFLFVVCKSIIKF